MDAPPPDPRRPTLEELIRTAASHLEDEGGDEPRGRSSPRAAGDGGPAPIVPGPALAVWRRVAGFVLVVAVALFAAVTGIPKSVSPDAARIEADLRWSVAELADEVIRTRDRTGRLPGAADLRPFVSEVVRYEPGASGVFAIEGRREGVYVRYESSLDLEAWREGRNVLATSPLEEEEVGTGEEIPDGPSGPP